jgi:hypothetical protein
MRVLACLSTLAAATLVSSISLDFGGSQNPIIQDDKVTVPGENPLDVSAARSLSSSDKQLIRDSSAPIPRTTSSPSTMST